MAQLLRKLRRAVLKQDPSFCDMYTDARASQAAEEYLRIIRRHLRERFGEAKQLSILDAGCQAGRLLIPLAEEGHRLIGIDTSHIALRRMRQHVQERRVAVRLHRGNIAKLRQWVSPASLDAVICAEVLYLSRDYEALLSLLMQSLKPGGLLCVSHRPAVHYVAAALEQGSAAQAVELLERIEGPSPDGKYHNWQTESQLRALYERLGCAVLACEPIDYRDWSIDPLCVTDDAMRQWLHPFHQEGRIWRTPSYQLVIAQRASWAAP